MSSSQTLGEIVSSVKRVTDIIGEIAAASQEQSAGIDQVNRTVTQMDHVVQSNAAQTVEMSATAESLSAQAEQLQTLVARFKLGDERPEQTEVAVDLLPDVAPPESKTAADETADGTAAKAGPKPVYYIGSSMRH